MTSTPAASDDAAFDAMAKDNKNRPDWDWNPSEKKGSKETNCVAAVSSSLRAGGVPVNDPLWPGNLGDKLSEMANKKPAKDQKWSVSNAQLQDIPGTPQYKAAQAAPKK